MLTGFSILFAVLLGDIDGPAVPTSFPCPNVVTQVRGVAAPLQTETAHDSRSKEIQGIAWRAFQGGRPDLPPRRHFSLKSEEAIGVMIDNAQTVSAQYGGGADPVGASTFEDRDCTHIQDDPHKKEFYLSVIRIVEQEVARLENEAATYVTKLARQKSWSMIGPTMTDQIKRLKWNQVNTILGLRDKSDTAEAKLRAIQKLGILVSEPRIESSTSPR